MAINIGNDFFDRLEGTWQNRSSGRWLDDLGWNFISQPKRHAPDQSDFEMRFDQMRETLPVRSVIGSPWHMKFQSKIVMKKPYITKWDISC